MCKYVVRYVQLRLLGNFDCGNRSKNTVITMGDDEDYDDDDTKVVVVIVSLTIFVIYLLAVGVNMYDSVRLFNAS